MRNAKESRIIQRALKEFRRNLPQKAVVDIVEQPGKGKRDADCLLHLMIDGQERLYLIEIRTILTKADMGLLLIQRENLQYPILLLAEYIPPGKGEWLREEKMQFIDAAGNAYIDFPPLFIYIQGRKKPINTAKKTIGRAFHAKGLKVIYAFLCNPVLVLEPYRYIADTAGVALGTVGWLMKELKELGYLLDMGRNGCRLIRKEELLNRWVTAYPDRLKPKLLVGFYVGDTGWWQGRILDPELGLWGGEVAAARLTENLKPQVITVYTTPMKHNRILLECRLRKAPDGDIEVYEKFWETREPYNEQHADLVHPILIYADLVATGNQRNIEIAKRIYEQHIVRLVGEG
jgi:hypothetical protein